MSLVDPTWPEPARRLIESQQKIIEALQARVEQLERRSREQDERIADLEGRLEKALRAKKRQAAPFRKPRKKNPKKPGRKSGKKHGGSKFRGAPEKVDRELEARLPSKCDDCGGALQEDRVDHQFQVDSPPVEPVTTQINVHIGHCVVCERRHQGRHPEQTSDALGNARWQIGPSLLAFAAYLNKVVGAPYAKITAFFAMAFQVKIAPSTLVRAMTRLGRKLEPAYEEIRSQVQSSDVVYPDETGWRVGGAKAWLWVFVSPLATLYRIATSRGFDVASEALGEEYGGSLGHDGWSIYDQFEEASHQTCLNHLITRCRRMLEVARKRAVSFPRALKALLQKALDLRDRRDEQQVSPHGLRVALGRLKSGLDRLLKMKLSHKSNARLAKHVRKHKEQVFTFLDDPEIEATNHQAEQALRPAVLIRKVGGCNKSWNGARAHEILLSLFRTAKQRGVSGLTFVVEALRCPRFRAYIPPFLKDP